MYAGVPDIEVITTLPYVLCAARPAARNGS
jgi:hypothetical protein